MLKAILLVPMLDNMGKPFPKEMMKTKIKREEIPQELQKFYTKARELYQKNVHYTHTALLQNYPNPFNPETWIPFKLSDNANVVISIYDVQGQLVRKIGLGDMPAGVYVSKDKALHWDGKNSLGQSVASGLYFYTLQVEHQRNSDRDKADTFTATRKMVIVK